MSVAFASRDAADDAVDKARRSDEKLPLHVTALALLVADDYAEVATEVPETLDSWKCWDWRGVKQRVKEGL